MSFDRGVKAILFLDRVLINWLIRQVDVLATAFVILVVVMLTILFSLFLVVQVILTANARSPHKLFLDPLSWIVKRSFFKRLFCVYLHFQNKGRKFTKTDRCFQLNFFLLKEAETRK